MFNDAPIELPIRITISALPTPYMARSESPTIRTTRKRIETSSVSFVFSAFLI